MAKHSQHPSAPFRALALAALATLSGAADLSAVCIASRSPDRDLWIEVVSCSDRVRTEVADELFFDALAAGDSGGARFAAPRAAEVLRESPGVLLVARELAFADSTQPFSKRTPQGGFETAYSDRPGEWQSAGTQPERRFFLGSDEATCETFVQGERIVVREVFRCCDTGRGPEIGCILRVSELVPSPKAPPTAEELSEPGSAPAGPSEEPPIATGSPKIF